MTWIASNTVKSITKLAAILYDEQNNAPIQIYSIQLLAKKLQ